MYVNVTHCTHHIGWIIIFISMKVSPLLKLSWLSTWVNSLTHYKLTSMCIEMARSYQKWKLFMSFLSVHCEKLQKDLKNNFFTLSFSTLSHLPIQSIVFACTHYKIISNRRHRWQQRWREKSWCDCKINLPCCISVG